MYSTRVNGDTASEPTETFSLTASNPLNTTISGASATGTIVDDDTIKLLLDASGPRINQAAALDALLLVRDPFRVVSIAEWWNFGGDRNTRVAVFTAGLTLNVGETASAVTINLVDSNSQSRDIAAEARRPSEQCRHDQNRAVTSIVGSEADTNGPRVMRIASFPTQLLPE